MATFEEALPGLQAQGYGNVMDALAAYNASNQASYFGTPAPTNTYSAPASPVTTSAYDSGGGGISSLPASSSFISGPTYDPNKVTDIASLYQYALGRAPDVSGQQYWQSIASGGISPEEYQQFIQVAQPELQVQKAYQDVLGRQYDLPGLEYYTGQLQSGAQTTEDLRKQLAYGANNLIDQLAAQKYLGQNVFGSPEDLRSQYQTSFGQTLKDVFGTSDVSQLATSLGTTPEKLSYLNPSQYETSSISAIQKTLQQSEANRYQEANQLFKLLPTVFGLSQEDALKTARGLYSGQSDGAFKDIYNDLLTQGLTPEIQNKILSQAATSNPDSPYFKANPDKLAIYTPLSTKEAPGAPGQYGYYNNAPILSAKEADKLLGGEVIKGGNNYFGYGNEGKKDDALGWDLRSKYAGAIANGAGIFGVNATSKDISDFDKIEKEIAKLGGIKTERDADGNIRQFVYKDSVDPDSGQKTKQQVSVESLFATQNDESGYNGYDRFKTYEQTKDALAKGAEQLKLDPSQFSSVKGLFDAVNNKSQNLYVVTGKANNWDPSAAEAQGITGLGQDRGGVNHAQVLYQKTGDKLIPIQTLKTFNFDDPNTSSGFLGDILQGPVLPLVMMALSAYTGGLSSLLSPLTAPATAALVEAGLPQLLASSLTNAAVSSGFSELTGGDWKKAGLGSLTANLIGGSTGFAQNPETGIYEKGFTPGYGEKFLDMLGYSNTDIANLVSPTTLARLGGTYAGALAANTDPSKVLINQAISQGFRGLPGGPTKSNFGDDLYSFDEANKNLEFTLSPEQKAALDSEYQKVMAEGIVETPGITGLSLGQEDWMIDALKDIVPLFMAKGLSKADATMLASNLLGATSQG